VITSTDPVSGWHDPLGKPLIEAAMEGLGDVPNPFDPGAAIAEDGTGWLTFGGGVAKYGNNAMPHTARIVKLGEDLLSVGSEIREIPAPYFYEASELNIIGDTFLYTFNTNWEERTAWGIPDAAPPSRCSMCCMSTKTPLDSESWIYQTDYFANPGDQGYSDSNNHTHLQEFCGKWYLFYHTLQREAGIGASGGFRSLCVTEACIDSDGVCSRAFAGDQAVTQMHSVNPYDRHDASELSNSAAIRYISDSSGLVTGIGALEDGSWICVRGVDFGTAGAKGLEAEISGGGLEVRLDTPDAAAFAFSDSLTGNHDIYLCLTKAGTVLKGWRFLRSES